MTRTTALDDDVEAFQEALENRVSELNPYTGGISGDAEAANEAEALADEIERSFQAATMDRQPAWVEGQNRGIINVGRYEVARQSPAFDTDFYRDWVEDDQPGYNMAVSLMLDYSSSMCWATPRSLPRRPTPSSWPAQAGHPLHRDAVGHRSNGALRRQGAGRWPAHRQLGGRDRPELRPGRPGEPAVRQGQPHRPHHDGR